MVKLPKPYLSWSQYNLWRTRKSDYSKRYFEGKERYVTKEMQFGSNVADWMESENLFDVPPSFLPIQNQIEVPDMKESCIVLQRKGYYILGYMDGCMSDYKLFYEYKTGKKVWDQARVEGHGQLDMYAAMIYESFNIMPKCRLRWIETVNGSNGIECTGRVEKFERKFTKKGLKLFLEDVDLAAEEISEAYQSHLKTEFAF